MSTSGQSIVIGEFDDPASADRAIRALQQAGYSNDQIRYTIEENRPKGLKGLFTGEKAASRERLLNDLINLGVDPDDARVFQHEYEQGHPLVAVEGRGNMQEALNILVSQGGHGSAELASRHTHHGIPEGPAETAETRIREAPSAGIPGTPGRPGETAETRTREMPPEDLIERTRRAGETAETRTSSAPPTDLTGKAGRAAETAGTRAREALTDLTGKAERADETAETRTRETPQEDPTIPQKMRLQAERLKAYTQPKQAGEVDVRKEVVTEQQTVNVPVTHEEVVIERHPPTEGAAATGEPIAEGQEIRVPLREEQPYVTKETVTTGEVEVSKREVKEDLPFTETVRREEASIRKKGEASIRETEGKRPLDEPPDESQMMRRPPDRP